MNKKTLVLGASLKPNRYSNYVIKRLIVKQFEVVALGLEQGEVSGVSIDTEMVLYNDIHTVTLYLSPEKQKPYYNYIVALHPKRVIFNPGTENPELFAILKANNVFFETSCSLALLSTDQY